MLWQNLASEEANISSFLGFSMVKIRFLQKVLKNGLVSEKKYLIFFPVNRGEGGGSRPVGNFP